MTKKRNFDLPRTPWPSYQQIAMSNAVMARSQRRIFPDVVSVCGKRFIVLQEVLSPRYFGSTDIFSRWIMERNNGHLLEVGCGAGITGVLALKAKAAQSALLVDINPFAVRSTWHNIVIHDLLGVARTRVSDVFSGVRKQDAFDTIYWNLPFIWRPSSFEFRCEGDRALYDPGYEQTRRLLAQARRYLRPFGRLLIGFGDFGHTPLFLEYCEKFRWDIADFRATPSREGGRIEFQLYELWPL